LRVFALRSLEDKCGPVSPALPLFFRLFAGPKVLHECNMFDPALREDFRRRHATSFLNLNSLRVQSLHWHLASHSVSAHPDLNRVLIARG
jgi:hypothetical protein